LVDPLARDQRIKRRLLIRELHLSGIGAPALKLLPCGGCERLVLRG